MDRILKVLPMITVIISFMTLFIGGTFLYFQLQYVLELVNPTKVVAYEVNKAKEEMRTDIRECLVEFVILNKLEKSVVLGCTDRRRFN